MQCLCFDSCTCGLLYSDDILSLWNFIQSKWWGIIDWDLQDIVSCWNITEWVHSHKNILLLPWAWFCERPISSDPGLKFCSVFVFYLLTYCLELHFVLSLLYIRVKVQQNFVSSSLHACSWTRTCFQFGLILGST